MSDNPIILITLSYALAAVMLALLAVWIYTQCREAKRKLKLLDAGDEA